MSIFVCAALFCIFAGVVHAGANKAIREIEANNRSVDK